jgi:uncharacterized Zn finger protein (UPF0148 family)
MTSRVHCNNCGADSFADGTTLYCARCYQKVGVELAQSRRWSIVWKRAAKWHRNWHRGAAHIRALEQVAKVARKVVSKYWFAETQWPAMGKLREALEKLDEET